MNFEVYSESYLIQKMQEAERILGRNPTKEYINSMEGFPSSGSFQYYFGSWKEALKAAGYEDEGLQSDEFKPGCWIKLRRWDGISRLDFGGVYVAYLNNEVVYVGSGNPVGVRLQSPNHYCYELFRREDVKIKIRRNRKSFEHLTLEARLIWRIKPRFNERGK